MGINTHSLDLEASSSQYASITDASQTGLDITGDFSFECWFKPETISINQNLISKWVSGNRSYRVLLNSTNELVVNYSGDGTNITGITSSAALSISTGTWYHIGVSVDVSAKTAVMSLDGSNVATDAATGTQTSVYNGGAEFNIGAVDEGAAEFLDGLIDECRLWNVQRTVSDFNNYKDDEISGSTSGLAGYWRLNNDYTDQTTNANTLTGNNTPVFSTDVPFVGTPDAKVGMFLTF